MMSNLTRSPKGMAFERRISHWKKLGMRKRSRPRLPTQPAGGAMNGTVKALPLLVKQTFAGTKTTPGMNVEVVPLPLAVMEGRAWDAPRSRRVSSPVMTLNGRPEENSTMGESVKSPKKRLKNPSPDLPLGDCRTALVTQRWRWSFTELARSSLGKRLSCGSSGDCRSVESSIE